MKYIFSCAALAVCVLLSGCAATDHITDLNDSYNSELISGLVSASAGAEPDAETSASGSASYTETDTPVEVVTDVPELPEVPTASQPPIVVPTAEVSTTPDADGDFDIFYSEVGDQFVLSDEEMSFIEHSLLVGDSICSGFSEYGIVPHEYVAAKGNLGSRSFFDYTFKFRGKEEQTYAKVLKAAKPRYVFLSMGMNDVNMVSEEQYCENYRGVIQATLDGSNAEVFVAAITPICSNFCANSVIDSFNDAMREFISKEFPERVHFFNFGQYLKNEQGKLRSCLHSGDGIHLGPYCYYIALWEMHRSLMEAGLWDGTAPIGTFSTFEEEPPVSDEEQPPVTTTARTRKTRPTESADEPQEPKPAETAAATTTAETTAKPKKKKPAKSTKATTAKTTAAAKPSESVEPVDTTQPTELPQNEDLPEEISGEPAEAPVTQEESRPASNERDTAESETMSAEG